MITATATAPISGKGTFIARIMAGVACVASSVARLIAAEVFEWPVAAIRERPMVTEMGVIAVVDMAVETVRAVEPRARSDKHSTHIPVGPIVAVGRTVIRSIVEVPVRAHGWRPNVYANGNLGLRHMRTAQQRNGENCESENSNKRHIFSSIDLEP
jgi:quinol-cytochrome oxidoreductase complex cytochrome b subunit